MTVLLATQEAEIRRIRVLSQPRQIVREKKTCLKKKTYHTQKKAGGVARSAALNSSPVTTNK
jgi:hypothetical protein